MNQFENRGRNVLRKFDGQEPISRVEIVFAFFINHAPQVVLLGRSVLEHLVNLAKLERFLMLFISNTDSELFFYFVHDRSRRRLIFILRFPMPCASNQCNSASVIVPSSRRTVAKPFNLRQLPRPYLRTRRARM